MLISEITMYGKGNIQEHKIQCVSEIKSTKRRTILKLLQKTPKCALKLCFEAVKVSLLCVLLISKTRPFSNFIVIINLEQSFDFKGTESVSY